MKERVTASYQANEIVNATVDVMQDALNQVRQLFGDSEKYSMALMNSAFTMLNADRNAVISSHNLVSLYKRIRSTKMVMTKEQCCQAISEAFNGACVVSSCDSWNFSVENEEPCAVILMPDFVVRHIEFGEMTDKELTEIVKSAPSHAWVRTKSLIPYLVIFQP